MLLRIEAISEKKLSGDYVENPVFTPEETSMLWRGFRSKLADMLPELPDYLYSVQLHTEEFGKITLRWAAFEFSDSIPENMQLLEIPAGLYAVFLFRGGPAGFEDFLRKQVSEILPSLNLKPDQRPWFQRMGKAFNPFSEESEEEVWIPVMPVEVGDE
jgi:AraC family transcriptional regulator